MCAEWVWWCGVDRAWWVVCAVILSGVDGVWVVWCGLGVRRCVVFGGASAAWSVVCGVGVVWWCGVVVWCGWRDDWCDAVFTARTEIRGKFWQFQGMGEVQFLWRLGTRERL